MTIKYYKYTVLSVFLIICFSLNGFGQGKAKSVVLKSDEKPTAKNVISLKYKSDLMKREMNYRIILPKTYDTDKKERYSVLYLLHGLTGSFKDWSDKSKLAEYSDLYELIIVMPDGHNGWYTNSAKVADDKYESYIIDEFIPEIDRIFRTKTERENRVIAGLSMGGYGSLKFGLKYPDKFVLVGSFSGALRAAEWQGKDFFGLKVLADSITQSFGESNSKTRKDNNIFANIESKSRDDLDKLPFIYLDCGTEDGLIKQNQDFAKLLQEQKVPHEFRQLPGKHDWTFWDSQIQEFLQLSQKYIK